MKHVIRVLSHWGLLIHIYVSMAGFTLVLLFAITGFTLNHQDFGWGEPHVTASTLTLPMDVLAHTNQEQLGQHLRQLLGLHSQMTEYHDDANQIQATFAVPGSRVLITINRTDGKAEVEKETRGMLGRLDDLHKGFDSGPTWYWMIDISALLLTISSLTGMVTLLSLRARRRSGFIVASLGVAMIIAIYEIWVPR